VPQTPRFLFDGQIVLENKPLSLPLPIQSLPNHTSQTQADNWVALFHTFVEEHVRLFPSYVLQDWRRFFRKLRAFISDHASDMQLLFKLLDDLKRRIERELRGARVQLEEDPVEIAERFARFVLTFPEPEKPWDQLTEVERKAEIAQRQAAFDYMLGDEEISRLPPAEQSAIDLLLKDGCWAHKFSNAFKRAAEFVNEMWVGLEDCDGPTTLFTEEDAELLKQGAPSDRTRAQAATGRGAIAFTNLAGWLLNNTSPNKGLGDLWSEFIEVSDRAMFASFSCDDRAFCSLRKAGPRPFRRPASPATHRMAMRPALCLFDANSSSASLMSLYNIRKDALA
jgi:hypothetical protein